jgi:hypothetical protein
LVRVGGPRGSAAEIGLWGRQEAEVKLELEAVVAGQVLWRVAAGNGLHHLKKIAFFETIILMIYFVLVKNKKVTSVKIAF